jgi:hypothetical protein
MSSSPEFDPITVDYAIEQCTDLAVLRVLARQYRAAMLSEHEQGAHFLNIDDCKPCSDAMEEGEPTLACAEYGRRQHQFMEALGADRVLSKAANAWVVPKVEHDEDEPVTPNIIGDWIFRSAGQSDVEHTRRYAAQLLAAADELERREGAEQATAR